MSTGRWGNKNATRYLITGACGQVGQELLPYMRARFGSRNVIASDVRSAPRHMLDGGPFNYLDVTQYDQLARVVLEHGVDAIVHLAAMLPAAGEKSPQLALQVNNAGTANVLELARLNSLRVFCPSSIAVFGPSTPKQLAPDETAMRPSTAYGISKVHMELLGEYYHRKFGVDFRSLRYPGVISSEAMPGGGATDYAVEMFRHAAHIHSTNSTNKTDSTHNTASTAGTYPYRCFLRADATLPMMYMPDLLRATVSLLEAPSRSLSRRTYNVAALSVSPSELAAVIKREVPTFDAVYEPDFRQQIAESWPQHVDDSIARRDWNWTHEFGLEDMAQDMLARLRDSSQQRRR